jgi:thioredoxin-related protein
MRKCFFILVSALFLFPHLAMSDVDFKSQTIKETLSQAKTEQKIILSVCSGDACPPCKWMLMSIPIKAYLPQSITN